MNIESPDNNIEQNVVNCLGKFYENFSGEDETTTLLVLEKLFEFLCK